MLTTEEKLGDWCSPVTRIVNHFGFQGGKKQALLTDVALFKKLEKAEDLEFRQWARDNYKPLDPIKGVWHPVIQDECKMMNEQFYEKRSNS